MLDRLKEVQTPPSSEPSRKCRYALILLTKGMTPNSASMRGNGAADVKEKNPRFFGITTPQRSKLMSHVRQRGTSLEIMVRTAIKDLGVSYSVSSKRLPGSPDLFSESERWAIFVNGCFWHGHVTCPHGALPRTNLRYWKAKIKSNRIRDRLKASQLTSLGYRVLTLWECEITDSATLDRALTKFFDRYPLLETSWRLTR